jgi:hypothetical protein
VLDVRLHLGIFKSTSDETLGIEHSVDRVHCHLVLRGISNETLSVRERHIRRRGSVTLVVGNNFDSVVLPYSDAAISKCA